MAPFPSNLFAFVLIISLFLLSVEIVSSAKAVAAKRARPQKAESTTPAIEANAGAAPPPGESPHVNKNSNPQTDHMIYHSSKTNDRCECGAFKSPRKSSETPLYYQTAMQNFHCDEAKCKEMCLALPGFSENRGVEILCAHVNQAHGLRPAVHYKNCNDHWMYAGSTQKDTICCEEGKVIPC